MFQIDRSANRLRKLERTSFTEVGFREREHLREWLATMPDALCEAVTEGDDALLIIQKEFDGFDGFDGTRKRLDLLALDRNGQLVIIENKPDDSGRNVVWQVDLHCNDDQKRCLINISEPCDGFNPESWPAMSSLMSDRVRRLEAAFTEPLTRLNQRLKAGEVTA